MEPSFGAPRAANERPHDTVRVLQLNLCNSGIAGCFTGRSVAEAASLIRVELPDLVSLNEICEGDLSMLRRELADVTPDGEIASAFQGTRDRRTGDVYRCRNNQPYGIGLISRWPFVPGSAPDRGIYPSQDTNDPEERAWLCLGVGDAPAMTVCTTHLASTEPEVAAAQCSYLFGTVISELRERVVVAGDLNLGSGASFSGTSCLPPADVRADDGGVQLVVATSDFIITGSRRIDLRGTTDHPGLVVTLAAGGRH